MNILLLFTYGKSLKYWDELGILNREISVYRKLLEKKIKFKFLTYGDENDLEYTNLLKNINILPIYEFIRSKNVIIRLFKSIILPIKLKNQFKNIDLIKTNQVEGSWIGIIAKILYKKKLIVRAGFEWFRNYLNRTKITKSTNYLKYLLNYIYILIVETLAYKLADLILLTNNSDIDFITKTFKLKRKKIRLLPNFIDTNLFKPLNIEKKDKKILFVGRLTLEKNLFNLIKAIKKLKEFSLDIVGSGPCENALQQRAKELGIRVNFLGIVPNNELPKIINQYQLFILPSYYEGNPKALLEAMSCGVACIGTNVRGINEIIIHKKNGYLCNLNSKSIENAILKLYNNNNLREQLSKNARIFIVNNFSLDIIANKEYLSYKEILKLIAVH